MAQRVPYSTGAYRNERRSWRRRYNREALAPPPPVAATCAALAYAALRQVAGYKREALAPPTVVRRMVLYESSARPFVVFAPLPTADVSLAVPLLLLKQLGAAPAGCQPVRLFVLFVCAAAPFADVCKLALARSVARRLLARESAGSVGPHAEAAQARPRMPAAEQRTSPSALFGGVCPRRGLALITCSMAAMLVRICGLLGSRRSDCSQCL